MRNIRELKEEDIVQLIEIDDICRNKYLNKFVRILCNNGYNQVFSLDGAWGSGKTTFVKKLELLINFYSFYENGEKIENNNYVSENTELSESSIKKLETISTSENYKQIKEMIRNTNLNAIYFNAWEHDDETDPIISIIYEIVNKFDLLDSTKRIGSGNFIDNLKSLVSLLTLGSINLGTLIEEIDIASSVRLKGEIKNALSETLNDIINENCQKLVIFIDELDRCKPDYAINLLEKINHYVNDDRVIIVLSTNIKELIHTISAKYGNEFSAERYLDKFIDERLFLPAIPLDYYLRTFDSKIQIGDSNWLSIVTTHFIKKNNLEMREINRYMGCMRHFEKYIFEIIPFDNHMRVIYSVFIPYIVGLYTTSHIKFDNFKKGDGYSEFKEFVSSNKSIIRLCKRSFYGNEQDIEDVKMFNDLQNYYNLIFKEKDSVASIKLDNYIIYKDSFKFLENNISLLGDIAEFQEIKMANVDEK